TLVSISDKQITVQSIRDVVCNYFQISVNSLISESRKREVVQARQIAMYFAKQMTKDSLTSIGNVIGKRNHATVLHACKTVKDLIDTDKSFRYSIEEIERKLNA
nr:helix-turn-helix domain-containing protein [Candidatus Enterocola sp.]